MEFQAVLFDFDGVLGNTMDDNYRAWSRACGEFAIPLDRHDYFLLEGLSVHAVARTVLARHGQDPALVARLSALKERYYLENNQFHFYPGALELVSMLGSTHRLGLVSGSGRERLRRTAGEDFLAGFQVVVTGDRVERCKPDPEPYLLAARLLGIDPPLCLVVENAPLGIRSAKSAGMSCIGVCSTLTAEHLSGADRVVPDLRGVADLVLKPECIAWPGESAGDQGAVSTISGR
ncbi:MAG: HAD family phosphatase [Magnetococcales bacterium]|nr:HAD family phosphatase [Magnetococcales bacterium]